MFLRVLFIKGAVAACQSQAKKTAITHSPHSQNTEAQTHPCNQTGGDLDCLSAVNPEGLLPRRLVFNQSDGTCNAAQKRHHRICLSLLLILNADGADEVFPPR